MGDDSDIRDFIDDCCSRGLVVSTRTARPKSTKARAVSVGLLARFGLWTPLAIQSLRRADRQLRRRGFSFAHAYHDAYFAGLYAMRPAAELGSALVSFYRAESFVPMPGAPDDCLPRSLALFAYLRSLGFQAEHLIGVRRYPSLTMHAWVEVEGDVVADRIASKEFVPLACIGTARRDPL